MQSSSIWLSIGMAILQSRGTMREARIAVMMPKCRQRSKGPAARTQGGKGQHVTA